MASNPPQNQPYTGQQIRNLSDADLLVALQHAMTTQAQALQTQGWNAPHGFGYSITALMNEADRRGVWQNPQG